MTDKNVENLISKLSGDLSAVKVHWSAEKRSFLWLTLHATWIGALGLFMSHSSGFSLGDISYRTDLYLELFLFFIVAGVTSFASFASMVPGRLSRKIDIAITLAAPVILLTLFIVKMMTSEGHMFKSSMLIGCEFQIFLYTLAPIFHLYYMIRNGEHYYSKFTFYSMGTAAALLPSALMHIVCMGDYKHVVIYHIGTVAIIAVLTSWAMKKALNK